MHKKPITYIFFPALFVICLWIVKLVEYALNIHFTEFGIYPGNYSSLVKIISSPFIHGNFNHLISNTLPLFFLSVALFYFYPRIAYRVIIFSWLLTGLGVWLGGRHAWHIGASGLVYAFASFLFFAGIISKNRRLMAISLLVIFLYGGLIWGIFPNDPNISWEAHLFGFFSGIILVYSFTPKIKFVNKPYKKKIIEDFSNYDSSITKINYTYRYKDNDVAPPKKGENE